jgi:hypothetical protein
MNRRKEMKDSDDTEGRESDAGQREEVRLEGWDEGSFVHYAQAQRYGIALAKFQEYRERTWEEIEPEARRQWEEKYERPWEEFAPIVRESWAEVKVQFPDHSPRVIDPDAYEVAFRTHFQRHYAGTRYGYRDAAPAYHYGYDLGVDRRLRDKTWADIEPEARAFWEEEKFPGFWQDLREAVHYAWRKVRGEAESEEPAPSVQARIEEEVD